MARPPATDEAFLREVDEAVRRDQAIAAARRWGVLAIGGIVLLLAAFAGWLYWQHRQGVIAGEQGEKVQAALEQITGGQAAAGVAALTPIATQGTGGYRAVALLTQGEELLRDGKIKGAVAKFAAVSGDASLGQPFRDLATVRAVAAEFDTLPPQQAVERLRPLAVPGNPWFGSAGEMSAIAQLRLGRRDLAGKLFGQVAKDETVPASIRSRAVQMAGLLGVDAAPSAGATP